MVSKIVLEVRQWRLRPARSKLILIRDVEVVICDLSWLHSTYSDSVIQRGTTEMQISALGIISCAIFLNAKVGRETSMEICMAARCTCANKPGTEVKTGERHPRRFFAGNSYLERRSIIRCPKEPLLAPCSLLRAANHRGFSRQPVVTVRSDPETRR